MTIKDILYLCIDRPKFLEGRVSGLPQSDVSWDIALTVSGNIHDVKSFVFIDLYRETETE